jgi:hypothetical protein
MVDRLIGEPLPEEKYGIPSMAEIPYEPPPFQKNYDTVEGFYIARLWNTLDQMHGKTGGISVQRKNRIALYQSAISFSTMDAGVAQLAEAIKWRLNQWDDEQRKKHHETMERGFQRLLEVTPSLRQSIEDQKNGVPDFFKNWQR